MCWCEGGDKGGVLQDWAALGELGRDMTMSSVGEMLAARYGLAVLVLKAMPTGEMVGELYTRGNAGDCGGCGVVMSWLVPCTHGCPRLVGLWFGILGVLACAAP